MQPLPAAKDYFDGRWQVCVVCSAQPSEDGEVMTAFLGCDGAMHSWRSVVDLEPVTDDDLDAPFIPYGERLEHIGGQA